MLGLLLLGGWSISIAICRRDRGNDSVWRHASPPARGRAKYQMKSEYQPVRGVYALSDPTTGRVRYIGKSVDTDFRYRQHVSMYANDNNLKKMEWLSGLLRQGLKPNLKILRICQSQIEMNTAEKELIREFKAQGEAELNVSPGGSSRSADRVLNTHFEEWFQFADNISTTRDLLINIANDAGRMASVRHLDGVRKLIRRLDQEVNRIDKRIRARFPEWEDVSEALRSTQDPGV
jgi:hypothetical protein